MIESIRDLEDHGSEQRCKIGEDIKKAPKHNLISKEEIIEKAIKRAKWWGKRMKEDGSIPRDYNYWKGRFDEIKDMFDLTEDDLK